MKCSHVLPIEGWFLSAVEGILQLFDEVGLPRETEQTLLLQSPASDKIHTLFHQHGGQLIPVPALVPYRFLQLLTKNTWNSRNASMRVNEIKMSMINIAILLLAGGGSLYPQTSEFHHLNSHFIDSYPTNQQVNLT